MDAERWQVIKGFLDRLAELPRSERSELLKDLRERDPQLNQEVLSYLPYGETAESFIDEPLWQLLTQTSGAPTRAPSPLLGSTPKPSSKSGETTDLRIGPYRLKELLGRGGMGKVHLAVREDDYEQKVAIKQTIGPLLSDEMEARFANERQILANLQHPDIARLLDGGTDSDGMPYLVMEFVEGEPINEYCENHQLDLRQRLRLFRKVCKAVHFAHQRLVVHRDLKAGNILVTADGRPKLLDFGIAKLLQESADSDLTSEGRVPLTLSCASPEQLMGEPISTAADVYALGLLLYELLAGVKAYDLDDLDYSSLVRSICLQEPPKPSVAAGSKPGDHRRFSNTTGTESTDPQHRPSAVDPSAGELSEAPRPDAATLKARRRRSRRLKGDLDAIVMKAIRKEPRHRYESAADLADDVLSYLQGLPVQARKGNWLYHTGKHLKRNRPALVVLLLIAGLAVTSTVMWQLAERREADALAANAETEAMNRFLTEMLKSADPDRSKGEELTVKEVLMASQDRIAANLGEFPDHQIDMYDVFAQVFYSLRAYDQSLAMRQRALEELRRRFPEESDHMATKIANVGAAHYALKDYRAAERFFREAVAMREKLGLARSESTSTIRNLASCHLKLGRYEKARKGFEEVLEIRLNDPESDPPKLGSAYHGLGTFLNTIGDYPAAIENLSRALTLRLETEGSLHSNTASTLSALGSAHLGNGDPKRALVLLRRALAAREQLFGPTAGPVGFSHRLLAEANLGLGSVESADRHADTALEILRSIHSTTSWEVIHAEIVKGKCLTRLGRVSEAEAQLLTALEKLHGQEHPLRLHLTLAFSALVDLYEAADLDEKARLYRAELATYSLSTESAP